MRTRLLGAATSVLLLTIFSVGCGPDPASLPEWSPEDHAQPEGSSTGSASQSAQAAPATPEEGRRRAAAALFRMRCAECHGPDGRGDGPMRTPEMQMPDFTSPEWQSAAVDETLAASITHGRGVMPSFGGRLPEEAITALVEHVRTLGGRP